MSTEDEEIHDFVLSIDQLTEKLTELSTIMRGNSSKVLQFVSNLQELKQFILDEEVKDAKKRLEKLQNEEEDEDEDDDEDENEDNALKALGHKYERLTVQIIRDQFWDPIAKKGRPITFFDTQDYESILDDDDVEWETMTPTGNLIKGHNPTALLIKDWLSTSTNGPYKDQGETGDIFYYLEFEESHSISGDNIIQIGWCGSTKMVNNYMTMDALDCVDCWIKKPSN